MSAPSVDPLVVVLALGVAAIFGLYFWHAGAQVVNAFAALAAWADRRADIQRASIDGAGGRESLTRRAGQILSLGLLIGVLAYALTRKFGLL